MTLSGQSVWVLGYGFLGRVLATLCRAADADVLSVDVSPATSPRLCADMAHRSAPSLAMQAGGGEPAVIFCCMATHGGSVEEYRRCYLQTIQVLGGAGLLARCVFCSSSSLYGEANERSAILADAESPVLAAGGCVARLVPLYGAGRCELLRRHLAGEARLPGPPERVLNYVHVEDAAAALILLAEKECRGIYDICGESFTKRWIYAELERITRVPASSVDAAPGRRGMSTRAVNSDALRALGWVPRHKLAEMAAYPASDGAQGNR